MEVTYAVEIDTAVCTSCGVCVESCPTDVFVQRDPGSPPTVLYGEDCEGCFLCVIDCAYQAVEVTIDLSDSASRRLGLAVPPGDGTALERHAGEAHDRRGEASA